MDNSDVLELSSLFDLGTEFALRSPISIMEPALPNLELSPDDTGKSMLTEHQTGLVNTARAAK